MEIIAEGLLFPEGPIIMPDGSVILVEIKRQTLSRVSADGAIDVIAELPGGPNGAAFGPDGKVYVCNNGGFLWREVMGQLISGNAPDDFEGGSIQRVDIETGAVETLYTEVDGHRLKGPNDIVFDRTGGFWFSDLGKEYERNRDHGGLYYAAPDVNQGGGSNIVEAAYPLVSPNGVGLSPDETIVYVADTVTGRLWAMDLDGPGEITPSALPIPGRVIKTLPDLQFLDSLAVEAGGNICVGTLLNGGVTIFTPQGESEHIAMPDLFPTNICFGGADMRDAYITLSGTGKLAKMRWPRPGLKLNFAPY